MISRKITEEQTLDQSQFDNTQTHMNQIYLDERSEGGFKFLNLKRELTIENDIDYSLQKQNSIEKQVGHNCEIITTCANINVNSPSQIGEIPSVELNNIQSIQKHDSSNSDKAQHNNDFSHQKRISQLNLFQNRFQMQRKSPNLEQLLSAINNVDSQQSQQYKKASIANYIDDGQEDTPIDVKSAVPSEVVPVRLMKAINLLVNVKQFYRQITKNSRIFEKITLKQHQLIGDITARFIKNYGQENCKKNPLLNATKASIKKCLSLIKWILRRIQLFQPNHIFKRLWDSFNAISIIYFIYIISLVIFFSMNTQSYKKIFTLGFIQFIIDMTFTFNTAITEKGNVNKNRQAIAIQYLKRNFIWDLLGLVPFIVIYFEISVLNQISSKIAFGFIVFKLFSLFDTLDDLSFFFSFQRNKKNLVDLFKVVFLIISVCHLFSILWHGLALYEMTILERDDTWINNQNLVDADIHIRYIYSFYFLAVTMQTVGYGDITPKNPIEILFTVITMFCTGMIWAFSLNSIGNIIENINKTNQEYKNDMQLIHSFMREEQVDSKLRVKVSNYLEYLHKESNENKKKKEKEIISKLSKQLQQDLAREVQGKFLKDIPIIRDFVSEKTQLKLISCMEEIQFSPDEIIFKQQEVDDSAVYYIVKGSVQLLFESKTGDKKEYIFQVLNKKQFFGEISFLTGQVRGATARASDFCRLFKIKREHFLDMVKKDSNDYENFQMVKEAVSLKNNLKFASIRCYLCNQGDHLSIKCPKTQLTQTKQIIFQKHNFSVSITQRNQHERRKKDKQYKTRQHLNEIQEIIFNFINNPEHQVELIELEQNFLKPEDEQIEEEISSSSSSDSSTDSESDRSSTAQMSVLSSLKNNNSDLDAVGAQLTLNRTNTIQRKSSTFATTIPRTSIMDQKPVQVNNKFPMNSLTPTVIKYSTTDLESDFNNKKRQSQMQFVGSYNQINLEPNYPYHDINQARHSMRRKSSQSATKIEDQQYSINFIAQPLDEPTNNEPKKSITASITLNDKQLQQLISMNRKDMRKNSQQPNAYKDKDKEKEREKEKDKDRDRDNDRKKPRESSYKQRKQIRGKNEHRKSIAFSQMPNIVTFQLNGNQNPLAPHYPLLPIMNSNLANSYSLGYSKQMSSIFNKQFTSQTTEQKTLHYITLEEMNRKFDKLHNFKVYYPHNNSTEVVAKYANIIQKNIDKLFSRKLFKLQVTRKIPKKMILSKNNLSFNKDFSVTNIGTPTRCNQKKLSEQPNIIHNSNCNLKLDHISMKNLQPIAENE